MPTVTFHNLKKKCRRRLNIDIWSISNSPHTISQLGIDIALPELNSSAIDCNFADSVNSGYQSSTLNMK